MSRPAPPRLSAVLSERLTITRIITSVVLVLLLLLGAWGATHLDPETAPDNAATEVAAEASVIAVEDAAVVADASGTAGFGLAACLLGAFCGLLLVLSFLRFRGRHLPGVLAVGSRRVWRRPMRPAVARQRTTLTLSELSVSRT